MDQGRLPDRCSGDRRGAEEARRRHWYGVFAAAQDSEKVSLKSCRRRGERVRLRDWEEIGRSCLLFFDKLILFSRFKFCFKNILTNQLNSKIYIYRNKIFTLVEKSCHN